MTWPRQRRWNGLRHRLEAPAVAVERVAERRQVERHRLQAGLEHQGPGHAGIVLEVAGEEPVVGRDGVLGAQIAAAPRTAAAGRSRSPRARKSIVAGLDARACGRASAARSKPGPKHGERRRRRRRATSSAVNDAPRANDGGRRRGGRSVEWLRRWRRPTARRPSRRVLRR